MKKETKFTARCKSNGKDSIAICIPCWAVNKLNLKIGSIIDINIIGDKHGE